MTDTESDYCDRLPGQHTGRLSLEMQASEAAEWQRSIAELEVMLVAAADTIRRLTSPASPAAGESPGISPEPAQAHGLSEHQLRAIGEAVTALRFCASQNDWYTEARATELRNIANTLTGIEIDAAATPSAAVGVDGPGAGDHKEWCDGAKEFCERQVESDTVPRSEYDRVVKLNHHLREAAVMAITEMVPTDSKPTNCHNPESEDTPPHNPVLGPVVGTAKVSLRDWCQKSSGTRFPDPSPPLENDVPVSDTVQPEVGKRYVCRNGEVTKPMQCKQRSPCYPFMTEVGPKDVLKTWTETGRHDLYRNGPLPYDLVAEYHDPEPSPPAESPDDWVPLRDPNHVIRGCDWLNHRTSDRWNKWRQVMLSEYLLAGRKDWTTSANVDADLKTGRTAMVEVPE